MRYFIVLFLLIFSFNLFAQGDYVSSVNAFRDARNKEFATSETSPYCDRKLYTNFLKKKSLKWYAIDASYKVTGTMKVTPDEAYFDNVTFNSKEPIRSRKYGEVTFEMGGARHTLSAYEIERVKNYVYIPFTDQTNQDETYRGGRYLNISRSANGSVTLDFNLAYNPDCAYDTCNICPVPPGSNRLPVRIEAGEKLVDIERKKEKPAKEVAEKPAKAEKQIEPKVAKEKPAKPEKPAEMPAKSEMAKPAEMDKPAPIDGKYADYNGVRVAYQDFGKGKDALIFIHGWTCNSDFWKGQLNAYGERRIIAIDLPGHGKSDKPKTVYTMEYFAKSIDAVMKKAGLKKAVFIGHSMGTPVIRQFYRLYPEKVNALVIVDGALRPFASKEVMEGFMAPLRADYQKMMPMFLSNVLKDVKDQGVIDQFTNSAKATPDYVAISAMEGMIDESIWGKDVINAPVLAILAESSFGQQKDIEQFMRSIIPNLDFRMWQGVGHFPMMENPQAFNQSLKFFLNKNKL